MSGFTAPIGGDSKRIDDVDLIPRGFQICTLYSLVDIGTQETNFGSKNQVRLAFEFPHHLRVFYEGGDPKPCGVFPKETLSMHKEGNLRKKFVQPMIGKVLSDEEAKVFDISSLLGKHFVANISHSPDGKWANIDSLAALDTQNMKMFDLTQPSIPQINPTSFFHLSDGFNSENFACLTNSLRTAIMTSEEGKKHKLSGGTFADQKNDNATSSVAPPPSGNGLIMIDKAITYEQYKGAGWTDEQLIANGKAKKAEAVAPPVIAAPPSTSTPLPPSSTPVPPAAPKKVLVFTDPEAQPLEEWIKNGWTEEMIIAQGYASFQ